MVARGCGGLAALSAAAAVAFAGWVMAIHESARRVVPLTDRPRPRLTSPLPVTTTSERKPGTDPLPLVTGPRRRSHSRARGSPRPPAAAGAPPEATTR